MHLQRERDHPRSPWRNGGGITAEVASWPVDAGAGAEFDWRISIAEVSASGEFSTFPGVDRTITLIDGPPMTLRLPGQVHALRPLEPFAFDGDLTVQGEVSARTLALNVMTRRGRATASVQISRISPSDGKLTLAAADPLLVVNLAGTVRIVQNSELAVLEPRDVVRSTAPLLVEGDGQLAVIRISAT